ncbi:hypothetical protein KY951_004269 [Vibrio parahaemolyticus]|nr:hypothetical protein [Vibrio parahaemolyticus]EHU5162001.1 hypothetical protein [Vibrio parahaemolyticus]
MQNNIFYSWQSDLEQKYNRFFIRDCLKAALKQLKKEPDYGESVRLDSDTEGVPGTPDIATTIFDKISSCSVFVADISYCTCCDSLDKSFPNSNVLIELGYAIGVRGDTRVLNVMNTAYGAPDELPFDLKHKRWPIQYCLNEEIYSDTDKRKQVKDKLIQELSTFIKIIIDLEDLEESLPQIGSTPSLPYIENCILRSDAAQDWDLSSNNSETIAVFRNDVNLRLVVDWSDDGKQCEDFKEPWANSYPNPHATGFWLNVYYGVSQILSLKSILVNVDGANCSLPLPRQIGVAGERTEVLPLDYKYAQIFDQLGNLDQYMWSSRLTLAL